MTAPTRTVYVADFEPVATFRELDVVRLLEPTTDDDGHEIAAGMRGTVVGIWAAGAAFEVEFAGPPHALATVEARKLERDLSE